MILYGSPNWVRTELNCRLFLGSFYLSLHFTPAKILCLPSNAHLLAHINGHISCIRLTDQTLRISYFLRVIYRNLLYDVW